MRTAPHLGLMVLVLALAWGACSTHTFLLDDTRDSKVDAQAPGDENDGRDASPSPEPSHPLPAGLVAKDLTYYQHVKAILDAHCVPCHRETGFGPFALETFAQARVASRSVHDAVASEAMPPFPPDDADCRALADVRNMPSDERGILEAWALAGAVEGDARTPSAWTVAAVPGVLGAATDTLPLGTSYEPEASDIPVHRCFVVEPALGAYTAFRAFGVSPSNPRAFRHALVHVALPGSEAAISLLEAEDSAAGYDCYYGGGFSGSITVSDWLVGASNFPFPAQTAITLPPGARFVVELDESAGRGADSPALLLWRTDSAVAASPSTFYVVNTRFVIPTGAADFEASASGLFVASDATPGDGEARAGTLWGVSSHLHLRGKSARIELQRKDGSRECLLHVPSFSTAWEGGYRFKDPVRVEAGDRLRVSCRWDNSARNQPSLEGKQLAPRDLTLGTSVLDETCVGSVLMTSD